MTSSSTTTLAASSPQVGGAREESPRSHSEARDFVKLESIERGHGRRRVLEIVETEPPAIYVNVKRVSFKLLFRPIDRDREQADQQSLEFNCRRLSR